MRNPRIAVIVPGGIGKNEWIPSLVQLLHRLRSSYSLTVYSYTGCEPHPLLTGDDCTVRVPPAWCGGWKPLSFLYFMCKILRDNRDSPFAVLHSFWILPAGVTAMAAAMFLRIRHVLSLPGGDTVWLPAIGYGGLTSALRRRLVRSCCAAADEVIVLTEYQKQHAAQNGLPLSRAVVIPFGVDTSEFAFQPMQFSLPLRLISIGSLNRVKNIFLQIEAYAILRRSVDCQFTIVGEDVNSGEARKFADSLHVGRLIQWMGHCAHTEIAGFLHNAHMLMHTALYEAEGVVIMEAFSAGTIVAGTRVGLLAETDSDGRCTIDGNDPALLAEKILTLWRDGQLTARLRETNRRYAERTSIDWTAGKYAELYSEVIRTDASP